jgi:hypothetical protein
MSDFTITKGNRLPELTATLADANGAINLSGATVRLVTRAYGDTDVTLDVAAAIVSAAAGTVKYAWAAGQTDEPGDFFAAWVITFADGRKLTVPNDGVITIEIVPDVAGMGVLSTADQRLIRGYVGTDTPPSDSQLAVMLERIGSAAGVALEVLRTRYADLLSQPASFSIAGEYSQSTGENIRSMEKLIAQVEALAASDGVETGFTVGVVDLVRSDPAR